MASSNIKKILDLVMFLNVKKVHRCDFYPSTNTQVKIPEGIPNPSFSGRMMAGPTKAHWVVTMSNCVMYALGPWTEIDFLLAAAWNFLTAFNDFLRASGSFCHQHSV